MANVKRWLVFGFVAVLLIAFGWALAYYNLAPKIQQLENNLNYYQSKYQQLMESQKMPMMIEFNQTGGSEFNMTSAVASDGSVANTTVQTLAWDMYNSGNATKTVKLTLVDPNSGEKGLPDWLQNSYVQIYVTINGHDTYLFGYPVDGKPSGKFTNGTFITIPAYSSISGSISLKFIGGAPAGTFPKGTSGTITLYIYDPQTHKEITAQYTVKT